MFGQRRGIGWISTANSLLLLGWWRSGSRRTSLRSYYSRRWKNTAVYGASQVQTTISCIFDASVGNRPENIGLLLWKALPPRIWRGSRSPGRQAAASQHPLSHPPESMKISSSKPNPRRHLQQAVKPVHFEVSLCMLWVTRAKSLAGQGRGKRPLPPDLSQRWSWGPSDILLFDSEERG